MEALTRLYRPRTFDEVIGSELKSIILPRLADENTRPQVWLFSGPAGTGKTTLARLLAKEYTCTHRTPKNRACCICEACKAAQNLIESDGYNVDSDYWGITELNIASDSGKERMKEVLDDALFPPIPPQKYKVLIFDECHMASNAAQNLLLKYVEEPPKHLIIIFCTTNREKMIQTLIDRCQVKITMPIPTIDELTAKLVHICKNEKISTTKDALRLIVRYSDRNPRRSILLLEEIANGCGKTVNNDAVSKYITLEDADEYRQYLVESKKGLADVAKFLHELKDKDRDLFEFMNGFAKFLTNVIYVKAGMSGELYDAKYLKAIKDTFKEYTVADFDVMLQIVEHALVVMGSNKTQGALELVMMTTASRLGKTKDYADGLSNMQALGVAETNAGKEIYEQEQKVQPIALETITNDKSLNSMLTDIFGDDAD